MPKRILNSGPNKLVLFDYDEADSKYIIQRMYWNDPVLRMTQIQRDQYMRRPGEELRPIANIPQWKLAEAYQKGFIWDKEYWRKWANDSDNKKFRITDGRM